MYIGHALIFLHVWHLLSTPQTTNRLQHKKDKAKHPSFMLFCSPFSIPYCYPCISEGATCSLVPAHQHLLTSLSINTKHCTEHGNSSRNLVAGRNRAQVLWSPVLRAKPRKKEKKKQTEELPLRQCLGSPSLTRIASLLLNHSLRKWEKEAQKAARKPTVHWLHSTPGERAPSAAVTWQAHLTLTQHLTGTSWQLVPQTADCCPEG